MRFLATTLFFLALSTAQAQRLKIADLLALTSCRDTICMAAFADSAGFCHKLGEEEDGWIWFSCEHVLGDSLIDEAHVVTLGYEGYGNTQRVYGIGTPDTTYAEALTEEIERLGFKVEKTHSMDQFYRNSTYPGLQIQRRESRSISIEHKGPIDPTAKPHPQPVDEHAQQMRNDLVKTLGDGWEDQYELIPKLMWVFKVLVRLE